MAADRMDCREGCGGNVTAVILTFLASFIGAALLIREWRGGRHRVSWLVGGILALWLAATGFLFLLLRWAVS